MLRVMLLAFFVAFSGCGESGLTLNIHYHDIRGLSVRDRVFYEDIPIGEVDEISRVNAGEYAVRIKIQKDFRHLLTEHARFYIIADPGKDDKKAVKLLRRRKGGALLAEGADIEGSVGLADRYQRAMDEFYSGLDELKDELESLSDQMSRIPEREEYQRLKRQLEEWAEKIRRSGGEAREAFEKQVLPRLQKELEELRERLRREKKEDREESLQV